jgi:hypothetical protein
MSRALLYVHVDEGLKGGGYFSCTGFSAFLRGSKMVYCSHKESCQFYDSHELAVKMQLARISTFSGKVSIFQNFKTRYCSET